MSEEAYEVLRARRALMWRRQRRIEYTLVIILPLLIGCCGFLFYQVHMLNQRLEDLTAQLVSLTQMSAEQQDRLEQWMEENAAEGQEAAAAEREEAAGIQAKGASQADSREQKPGIQDALQQETQAAHKVYLTFDDGPSKHTEEILEILEKYQVKAAFFVTGKEGESAKEAMRSIVDAGHTIGLHSYSHKYSEIYRSVEDFAVDFERLQDYVYEVTGVKSTCYRFPGGSSNTISEIDMHEFADYLAAQGVEFYDWNISSGDGGSISPDVETIVKNCTADVEKNKTSIILMHDAADKTTTLEALPIIIENILAMEDTVILPITEDTEPVHHIATNTKE